MSPIPHPVPVTRTRRRARPAIAFALAALLQGGGAARAADPPVVVTLEGVRIPEGHAGASAAVFTLRLSRAVGPGLGSVDFATEDRSALAGSDYAAISGTVALDDTSLAYPIAVTVYGDSLVEGNERFVMRLSNPMGVQFAESLAAAVVVNDERTRFRRIRAGLTPYYIGNLAPAFGSADDDAWPDLPLNRNLGFTQFEHHPGMAAALIWGNHHGTAWCDYDRDGRQDLVVTPYAEGDPASKLQLLRNLGNGEFVDVAPDLGMDVIGRAETPVWGDFDGDGWPDLFVPYYSDIPPGQSFMWRNNRDGTFTDVTDLAGVGLRDVPAEFRPEGADAVDWNGDGSLDLYCAQHLFLNDGYGCFIDVREEVGLPRLFDEGSKFVDADGDGDFDLYLRTWYGPKLFRNDKGQFTEITEVAGLPFRPLWWGDSWADVDNDGDMDLLLMNPGPSELYLNDGAGAFVADSAFAELGTVEALSAWADVDLDGDLDAAVGASVRELLINDLDQRPGFADGTLRVWVMDETGKKTSHGAMVRLTEIDGGANGVQVRAVDGGSGYLTQSEYPVHLAGIGSGRYWLQVRYPGSVHSMTIVDGRTHAMLEEFNPREEGMSHLFVFRDGHLSWHETGSAAVLAVAAAPLPNGALGRAWPQPARHALSITARLDGREANLDVHDLSGRRIRALVRGESGSGSRQIDWDLRDDSGSAVPSGVYFLRLVAGGRTEGERRVVVLR